MKVTVVMVAAIVVLVGGASADAALFGWDGGGSDNAWTTAANWRSDAAPPCSSSGTDTIELLAGWLVTPFNNVADWQYSSGTCQYSAIHIQASSSYSMTLKKSGAGTLTGGSMYMEGRSSSLRAILDVDAASATLTSLTCENSYCDVDVASGVTLDINGSLSAACRDDVSFLEKIGAGAITPDTIYVGAGALSGDHGTLIISNGDVTASHATNPQTSILATINVDADATLQFNGSGDTLKTGHLYLKGGSVSSGALSLFDFDLGTLSPDPNTLNMYGLSKIDTEQSFTVAGDFTVTVDGGNTFATEATVDIASGKTVTVPTLIVGDNAYSCKITVVGPGALTTN